MQKIIKLNTDTQALIKYYVYGVLLLYICYRAYIVGYYYTSAYSESGISDLLNISIVILSNDLAVIFCIALLEILTWFSKSKIVTYLARASILLVIFLYIADVLVYKYLYNRLNIDDLFIYGSELSAIKDIALAISETKFGLLSIVSIFVLIILMPFYLFIHAKGKELSSLASWFVVGAITINVILIVDNASAYNNTGSRLSATTYNNLFFTLANNTYKYEYSNEFKKGYENIQSNYYTKKSCVAGLNQRKNVIIILAESLSAYHSKYFSEIYDYTPKLDEIAKSNIAFMNFHANGYTTVGGYMSVMNGLVPIPRTKNIHTEALGGWIALTGFEKNPLTNSLAETLKEFNYKTIFMSNGDLDFAGSLGWLENLGFDSIVDASSDEFKDNKKRLLFNSVPDSDLFALAGNKISKIQGRYLLVLSTISTHRPLVDVITGKPTTEEKAYLRLDSDINGFYNHLNEIGYFKDGILIITGDHRAMTSPKAAEKEKYGERYADRIPFILVDKSLEHPNEIKEDYQQIDIISSLRTLVSKQTCYAKVFGNFYSKPRKSADCTFFARGDNRSIVTVSCNANNADVILSGDNTRFVSGSIQQGQDVVDYINTMRIYKGD